MSTSFFSARRLPWLGLALGVLLCALGAWLDRAQFFRSYWMAWLFWAGLGFGAVPLVSLHFLTGGRWGGALRQPAEAAMLTLPLLALLFLPAAFGLPHIFPWAESGYFVAHPAPHKSTYLQPHLFLGRTALYFAVLLPLVGLARAFGRAQRHRANAANDSIRAGLGGVTAVAYVLCMNFASTDWVMSLEPAWSSTIFAVIFMISQFLAALAFCLVAGLSGVSGDSVRLAPLQVRRDLGNLLLAFVVFWAYVTFSQFLIIWSGNLPREIAWYVHRRTGGWPWVAWALFAIEFALPFVLLLSRALKHDPRRLRAVAALVFSGGWLHIFWLVKPTYATSVQIHWQDLATWLAVGSAWLLVFQRGLPLPATALPHEETEVARA